MLEQTEFHNPGLPPYYSSKDGTTVVDNKYSDEKETVKNSENESQDNSDNSRMVSFEEKVSSIDMIDEVMDKTDEIQSFFTSTPKDYPTRCEECLDSSQCADCIVKHMFKMHESLRKHLF